MADDSNTRSYKDLTAEERREIQAQKNRDRVRAWRLANPEKKRAQGRLYNKRHPEKLKENNLRWRANNPERVKELSERPEYKEAVRRRAKEYRAANPDKVRETKAASYRKHREARLRQVEEARKANPEVKRAHVRNRRAAKRQADGFHTAVETRAIRQAQNNRCAYCGLRLNKSAHLDHIVPLSRGGSNWPSNLQWLCAPCNTSKGAKDPIQFAQQRGFLL